MRLEAKEEVVRLKLLGFQLSGYWESRDNDDDDNDQNGEN